MSTSEYSLYTYEPINYFSCLQYSGTPRATYVLPLPQLLATYIPGVASWPLTVFFSKRPNHLLACPRHSWYGLFFPRHLAGFSSLPNLCTYEPHSSLSRHQPPGTPWSSDDSFQLNFPGVVFFLFFPLWDAHTPNHLWIVHSVGINP